MTRLRRRGPTRGPASKPAGAPPLDRRHAWALLCLVAVGFVASMYLTYVHYRLHADPGWRSACDLDPAVSCDAVILSSYGSIRGMPLSILGAWFYFVLLLVLVFSIWGPRLGVPRSPAFVLFIGGAAATAGSIFLGVVSIAVLGVLCPVCVVVYAINAAIAATAWHAVRRSGEGLAAAARAERLRWRENRALSITVSLGALVLLVAGFGLYSHSPGASSICHEVAVSAASDRSLDLVIFCDFQSPHCRKVATDLAPMLRTQNGRLHVVSRHFPLDPACNRHAKNSRHAGSCRLALAALCADAQGKGAEFNDSAFDTGGPSYIEGIAASLGLNRAAFDACLVSDETSRLLQASIDEAASRDVDVTPTLFIGGTRHVGRLDKNDLRCLATAAAW